MPADISQPGTIGPLKRVHAAGIDIPYYVVRYDKDGVCQSTQTVEHLIAAINRDGHSHVLVYSHGWNNDFTAATALYDDFLQGLSRTLVHQQILPPMFQPVFVGIIWPSTALVFGSENGPEIAAVAPDDEKALLIASLAHDYRAEASAILAAPPVPPESAEKLARMVADALGGEPDAEVARGRPDADDILAAWRTLDPAKPEQGFTNFGTAPGAVNEPIAAGLEFLDPRWIVRLATVLIMKDRAGIVGANGVEDLIRRLLSETDAKVSLFGHSYGAKLVMTALAALSAGAPRRQVDSVLLLQPAVSMLCYAQDIGDGEAGGFVRALATVRQPVYGTWSSRDLALTRFFHLAARRALDLGEMQMANAPSPFAALGGFGARECKPGTSADKPLPSPGSWFEPFDPAIRVVSLDGSGSIGGHGDINRAETYWVAAKLLQ